MYELDRHRYLELKHFCLQYHHYKELYLRLEGAQYPVDNIAAIQLDCKYAMQLIERTAADCSELLGRYIFRSVTEDVSYSVVDPPCDHDIFELYRRKFFWMLSDRKGV